MDKKELRDTEVLKPVKVGEKTFPKKNKKERLLN